MSDISNPIGVVSPDADLEARVTKGGSAGTRAASAREEARSKAGPNRTEMLNSDRAGAPLGDRLKAGHKSTGGNGSEVTDPIGACVYSTWK